MKSLTINKYIPLLEPLDYTAKLELIAYLTESLKRSFETAKPPIEPKPKTDKEKLAEELFGAWADVDGEKLIKDIYESRTISTGDDINFD